MMSHPGAPSAAAPPAEGSGRAVPSNPSASCVDPFLKQRRTQHWNQDIVSRQVGLVLGVGGVGSTVAMNLVRMGFKKIFLIDRDIVDDHNLNRQILYRKEDVGREKVFAAVDGLRQHNICTEIVPLHIDAVGEWAKVVECARQSTCIFNGIDHGEYWDYAVASLARKLRIPHALGGTDPVTGHAVFYDFSTEAEGPCIGCMQELSNKAVLEQLCPERIDTLPTLQGIVPKDNLYKTGGSMVWSCVTGANIMVGLMVDYLMGMEKHYNRRTPNRVFFNMLSWDFDKYTLDPTPECEICKQTRTGCYLPAAPAEATACVGHG